VVIHDAYLDGLVDGELDEAQVVHDRFQRQILLRGN
jgi:hypothetical protein